MTIDFLHKNKIKGKWVWLSNARVSNTRYQYA